MERRRAIVRIVSAALGLIGAMGWRLSWGRLDVPWERVRSKPRRPYRIEDRLAQFGDLAVGRLAPRFAAAGVAFPPGEIALLAFKDTRLMQVYARSAPRSWTYVCAYPVLAASGALGPKLREGDEQVPEGIYQVTLLNPNSRFHVSLRVDYPNAFDQRMALTDGRSRLGGDIMIHGKAVSAGCLAMGDIAAEDLFALAAMVIPGRMRVVISPTDFRQGAWLMPVAGSPTWTLNLYRLLESELQHYPSAD